MPVKREEMKALFAAEKNLLGSFLGIRILLWVFLIYCLFDWRTFYERGVFLGLKSALHDLESYIVFCVFAVACFSCCCIILAPTFPLIRRALGLGGNYIVSLDLDEPKTDLHGREPLAASEGG